MRSALRRTFMQGYPHFWSSRKRLDLSAAHSDGVRRPVEWHNYNLVVQTLGVVFCLDDLCVSITVRIPVGTVVGGSIIWSYVFYCKEKPLLGRTSFSHVCV